MTQTETATVHQSRWGWHPVSRECAKKLRLLSALYQRALRRAAAWNRWNAKAPHNRVTRPKVRDAEGRTIGRGEPSEWKEPAMCFLCEKVSKKVYRNPVTGEVRKGVSYDIEGVKIHPVNFSALSRRARTPAASPELVKPLPLTEAEIGLIYQAAINS